MNMMVVLCIFLSLFCGVLGNSCQGVPDPCSLISYHDIPYIYTRDKNVGFFDDLTNRTYCDQYQIDLNVWYRCDYNITTECVGLHRCGTVNPVWMNGTIPSPEEGVVNRTACKSSGTTCCERRYSLTMKNCGTFTTYCFRDIPTACYQRFCFDVGEDATNSTSECPGTDLPGLTNRSVEIDTIDIIINDQDLDVTWFKTQQGGMQYLMADSTNMPQVDSCGTFYPIYLQDPHPVTRTMADGSELSVIACMRTNDFDCDQTYNIKIRKCGQEIQYYLMKTIKYAGYCFDIGYNITSTSTTIGSTVITSGSAIVTTGSGNSGGSVHTTASGVSRNSVPTTKSRDSQKSVPTTVGKIIGPDAQSSPSTTITVLIALISVLVLLLLLLLCYIIKRQASKTQQKTITDVMPVKMKKDRMFDGQEPTVIGVLPVKTNRIFSERGGNIPFVMPANTDRQHSVVNVLGVNDPPPTYESALGTN